jgi:Ca2+-binding RTX toxin-like protein
LQLNFDHAMVGTPIVGDFSVSSLNASSVPSLSSVSTVNLRQGLSLNFATAVSTPIKVIYSGTLTDEGAGRSVLNKAWMIGTDGSDVLDATSQTQGLTLLGGAGSDLIKGSSYSDVLLGGLGADTITGGAGSDTFKYVNEVQGAGAAGGLGGKDGDVITDFNFGRTDESQADRLDLSMLFDSSLAANGDATHDVAQLVDGKFMDIVQTRVTVNGVARKDWEVWVDRDGGGNYQRMVTLQGAGDALPSNYAGNETTSELLQKLLTEGRLTVAHA